MRLSMSEACNDVLVHKMALVVAKSERKPVIFVFIVRCLSLLSIVVNLL